MHASFEYTIAQSCQERANTFSWIAHSLGFDKLRTHLDIDGEHSFAVAVYFRVVTAGAVNSHVGTVNAARNAGESGDLEEFAHHSV